MKRSPLLDEPTAEILGFRWLCDAVAPVSAYGERHFSELTPFFSGDERAAGQRSQRIVRVAASLDRGRLAAAQSLLGEVPDVARAVSRATIGDSLNDPALLEMRRFCTTLERIDDILGGSQQFDRLSQAGVRAVRDALAVGQRDETSFYLADALDTKLAAARARRARMQAEFEALRGREERRVAAALGREELGDEFIVMRAELGGDLPAGVRVMREAATYLLCALEYDETVLAALQRRDDADRSVAQTEEDARAQLSTVVRENAAELIAAMHSLGEFDVLVAASLYSQKYRCTAAEIVREPVLAFEAARFLPLEVELSNLNRAFTPIDLELRGGAVLTGPNMGGKSVCLQTAGFVALCVAFGLPVPARQARVALFDHIAWLGLGREERIGGVLSSFAREVMALKTVFERDAARLLFFGDEFARTTTPHEGKALSIALLERLRARGACALLATHLSGVATAADVRHFAVRGLRAIPSRPPGNRIEDVLATLGASMDYRIAEVDPDESAAGDAIALADLLGLSRDFIAAAYRALSQ